MGINRVVFPVYPYNILDFKNINVPYNINLINLIFLSGKVIENWLFNYLFKYAVPFQYSTLQPIQVELADMPRRDETSIFEHP